MQCLSLIHIWAQEIAADLGGAVRAYGLDQAAQAFEGVGALINATSAGLSGSAGLDAPIEATPPTAVVMDMVYKPLVTPFLEKAQALGRPTVDGLAMLIGRLEVFPLLLLFIPDFWK